MERVKNWQISLTIIFLILGFLVAVQFRLQQAKDRLYIARSEILAQWYKEADAERRALQKEIAALREELARTAREEKVLAGLTEELDEARRVAGMTEVTGPGVIVTLSDSVRELKPGENPEMYLIHDEDLLRVINELFAAGAEAISINGQRYVATTEIRCAGPTASVNRVRIGTPFVIKAIGDPATLESALRIRGGVVEALNAWGIVVKVEKNSHLVIPAYRGGLQFNYAIPRKEK